MNDTPLGMPADDPDDLGHNPNQRPNLGDLIAIRLSRRRVLRFGLASGGMALLWACGSSGESGSAVAALADLPPPGGAGSAGNGDGPALALNFDAVAKHLEDGVAVPDGYTATVLYRLGDPIAAASRPIATTARRSGVARVRAGDHHDGMTSSGSAATTSGMRRPAERGLLVMNHEAITPLFLHPTGQTIGNGDRCTARAAEVLREFYVHGVSVIEVMSKTAALELPSMTRSFNRRVHTADRDAALRGPAAGKAAAGDASYSPDGSTTRGTINNCANGYTPWGTYLTCEENWAGYFRRIAATDNAARSAKELAALRRATASRAPAASYGPR